MIDQSRPLNEDDMRMLSNSQKEKSLVIINKIDLPSRLDEKRLRDAVNGCPIVKVSALTGEGINELRRAVLNKVTGTEMDSASVSLAPNLRHKKALMEASQHFKAAVLNTREGQPMEIIAVDLKSGLDALAEITGESADEELYEKIFSEFCLGK
jgi:tRNA modification GTPase